MARMARKAPARGRGGKAAKGGSEFDGMPLKQLLDIEIRLKKAIGEAKDRERQELKAQLETMALSSGFTVGELFSSRPQKGRTVPPKYINPENRQETWTGRGRKPRWLVAKMNKGAKLEDFAI